jgi:hypothetical protein
VQATASTFFDIFIKVYNGWNSHTHHNLGIEFKIIRPTNPRCECSTSRKVSKSFRQIKGWQSFFSTFTRFTSIIIHIHFPSVSSSLYKIEIFKKYKADVYAATMECMILHKFEAGWYFYFFNFKSPCGQFLYLKVFSLVSMQNSIAYVVKEIIRKRPCNHTNRENW